MTRQYSMYVGLGMWAVLMFGLLVASVRDGSPTRSVAFVILASPALLAALAVFVEERQLGELVDLRSGSWSFMIGDTFVLTSAVAFAALAWRAIPREGWQVSWWWTAICGLIGFGAGTLFHWWDGGNYASVGATEQVLSPTKLAHDFVAYPVLFGALLCVGVPLLFNWSWHTSAVLGCVVLWMVLAVCDGLRGLSPFDMHPAWDEHGFRVIPDAHRTP